MTIVISRNDDFVCVRLCVQPIDLRLDFFGGSCVAQVSCVDENVAEREWGGRDEGVRVGYGDDGEVFLFLLLLLVFYVVVLVLLLVVVVVAYCIERSDRGE